MLEKSTSPSLPIEGGTLACCATRVRDAPETPLKVPLLLTRGRALAYATPHSPWISVERAGTSDAPCSQGKGMCGAMLDVSGGGRAGTVVGARPAEGPAGSVQRCPGVPAVAGGTQERAEGRDGGVWAAGPGDRARRRRVVKARTRRAVAAKGRPERCATAARRTGSWGVTREVC